MLLAGRSVDQEITAKEEVSSTCGSAPVIRGGATFKAKSASICSTSLVSWATSFCSPAFLMIASAWRAASSSAVFFLAVLNTKVFDAPTLPDGSDDFARSEEHTPELQSHVNFVCRL